MDELADIYGSLAAMGVPKPLADEYELWDVGVALGMHRPSEDTPKDPAAGRDLIAERVAAAKAAEQAQREAAASPSNGAGAVTLREQQP